MHRSGTVTDLRMRATESPATVGHPESRRSLALAGSAQAALVASGAHVLDVPHGVLPGHAMGAGAEGY